jgi:4-amino-4-deoxy-L-arabinose transferase-like glycosyltransferase
VALGPALFVLSVTVALWLATGVGVTEIAAFGGYTVLFVLLPGWLAAAVLIRWPVSGLGRFVAAVALGEGLLTLAFVVTAAAGVRGLVFAYPLVIVALLPLALRRGLLTHVRPRAVARSASARAWAVAGVCVAALVGLALQSWLDPLPGSVASVTYGLDDVWSLSLAAEALHHWPLTDPTVAGTALPYHWFAALSAASASQVAGLSLPLVFFRLYLVPLVLVSVLGLCELGWVIARRPWAGPVTAVLALFAGEIDLDPVHGLTFGNEISNDMFGLSPTFLAGLVFFLPLLMLLAARIQTPQETTGWRWWLLWLILLGGAAAAKATILPVLAAGLGLWLLARGWRRAAPGVHGLLGPWLSVIGVYGLSYLVMYRGAGSSGLAIDPPGAIRQLRGLDPITAALHHQAIGSLVLWPLAVVLGLVGAYGAALVGLPWLARTGARISASQSLMLCLLLGGLVPFLVFTHPGLSQSYFSQYGLVAGAAVSAAGLCRLADRARGRWPAAASAGLAVTAAALVAVWILARANERSRAWFPALDLAVAALAAIVFALALVLGRRRGSASWLWPSSLAIVAVGLLNTPLDLAPHLIDRVVAGRPTYVQAGAQVTPRIAAGFAWIRLHTPTKAVLAVNNYSTHRRHNRRPFPAPDEYIYSALAERRVFLEGWVYANRSFQIGEGAVFRNARQPFPDRRRLNDAVFQRADRRALSVLVRRYGVRYLVVDRLHADASRGLAQVASLAYSNRDIAIYTAR